MLLSDDEEEEEDESGYGDGVRCLNFLLPFFFSAGKLLFPIFFPFFTEKGIKFS